MERQKPQERRVMKEEVRRKKEKGKVQKHDSEEELFDGRFN